MRKSINTLDVEVNEFGEIVVSSALAGSGKPDILIWNGGSDDYTSCNEGAITQSRRRALIYNNGCAALLSIADAAGEEKPFLIPAYFTREMVLPFEIDISDVIKIKNLEAGRDYDLTIEFL
jgi:hypothetical protein